jgi:acyl-CoA thioester hydrolase
MNEFIMPVDVRWSDLDPNFHVRHSVYYDWGAFCRIKFLSDHGLGPDVLTQHHIGPILFREECMFRKEIKYGDKLSISLQLLKSRKNHTRWSIRHRLIKNDNVLAAILTVEGAWMDTQLRKLASPPQMAIEVFNNMPKDEDFEWLD